MCPVEPKAHEKVQVLKSARAQLDPEFAMGFGPVRAQIDLEFAISF